MKIFENKVGRPSNEMKMLRRTFYVSMVALAVSVVAIVLSCVVNVKSLNVKTQGAASSKYKIRTSSKTGKNAGLANNWNFSTREKHTITYEVNNIGYSSGLYYRYYAYNGANGNLVYAKVEGDVCSTKIAKGVTKNVNKTIDMKTYSHLKSTLVLYTSASDCKNNKNRVGYVDMINKVVTSNSNSSNNTQSVSSADMNAFKALFQAIVDFFNNIIKSIRGGSGEPKNNNTTIKGEYTVVIDKSKNYRNGEQQKTTGECSDDCNCYATYFAERIKKGSTKTLACGCGKKVYSDGNECQSSEAAAYKAIRTQILKGNPVVAYVSTSQGHWITIIGIKTNSINKETLSRDDFLVADPLKSGENNWGSLGRKLRKSDNPDVCKGKYRLGY